MRNLRTYRTFESKDPNEESEGLLEYFFDLEDEFGVDASCQALWRTTRSWCSYLYRDPGMGNVETKNQIVISFPDGNNISVLEKFIPNLVEIVKKIESIGDYKLMGGLDQSQKNFGSISVNHSLTTVEHIFLSEGNLNLEYIQKMIDSKFHETIIDELEVVDICLDFKSQQ